MSKAMVVSAAVALALSGAAFAKGGSHSPRTGASADAYIDKSVTISASDCAQLSVESARAACMRSAQADTGTSIGATSGSASGSAQGGSSLSMDRNMPSGSNESKPEESSSKGASQP